MSQAAIFIEKEDPAFFPLKSSLQQFADKAWHFGQKRERNLEARKAAFTVVLSQTLLRYGLTIDAVDYVAYAKNLNACVVTLTPGVNVRDAQPRHIRPAEGHA